MGFFNPTTGKYQLDDPAVSPSATPVVAVAQPQEVVPEWKKKTKEWVDNGNGKWTHGSEIRDSKPTTTKGDKITTIHKNKDASGQEYYYDEKTPNARFDSFPEFKFIRTDPSYDIVVDYNPFRITDEQLNRYFEKLKADGMQKKLPFPLPERKYTTQTFLQTYDYHFKYGLYKDTTNFTNKISELEANIKGIRPTLPKVFPITKAIEHYKNMIELLKQKNYIYFPHIEFTAKGCFLMEEEVQEQALVTAAAKPTYKISAYTKPVFTALTTAKNNDYKLSGDTFSTAEQETTYNAGDPEYKFYYEIKFNSCIGECGIIELQYLVIRNIMTMDDEKINTSGIDKEGKQIQKWKVDITGNNSIMIVNSGTVNSTSEVIKVPDEAMQHFDDFTKAGVKPILLRDLLLKITEGIPYKVMLVNNYRRNVLEMLYFFSDANNSKIENIKPPVFNMKQMAENIFTFFDLGAKSALKQMPAVDNSPENYITGGGIRKQPQNVRIFLDRLKRMYNRYIRRNNKRTKKKRPKKNKTHRKRKHGIKKSKKN